MPARNKWLSWLGLALGGLLFLAQLVRGIDALLRAGAIIYAAPILLALGAILLAFAAQIVGWSLLMRGLGVYLAWPDAFAGYVLSFIPRYIPGMIWGYLSRGQWMHEKHSIAYRVTTYGSLLEIVIGISSACSVILIYVSLTNIGIARWFLLILAFVLPALVWLVVVNVKSLPIAGRVVSSRFGTNGGSALTLGRWMMVYTIYILLWACYGEALWATSIVVGNPAPYDLVTLTAIFAFAWVVGLVIIFIPAGLGIRELMLSGMLVSSAGLTADQAGIVAVGLRVVSLGAELGLIMCALAIHKLVDTRT